MNQWHKGIVSWKCGRWLYLSVPFTWLLDEAEGIAKQHKGKVFAGGPAIALSDIDWANTPSECEFDTLSMHNPCATFTTRGCPNKCKFCAVPKTEGDFRELPSWKAAPLICDNNLLAASDTHFARVIKSLKPFPSCDFNQGLEARRFKPFHADLIATLKKPIVRFAFDHVNDETAVADAIATGQKAGLKDFRIYVLVGFNDTPEDALYRLRKVVELGATPTPMRYQALDCRKKNAYVGKGWTHYELQRMTRYWSNRRVWNVPYDEFIGCGAESTLFKEP